MYHNKNIKLFPIYKLFAYDYISFYAISTLFLHNVKGISFPNIVLISSIYCLFQVLFQIPSSLLADKIGLKKCIVLGNILCTTGIFTYAITSGFPQIIIGDFQIALGFALKGVSESPFIFTIMRKENLEENFAKIEAKGSSLYFIIEAFAAVIAGYLFVVNPYFPIIISILAMSTATILSLKFDDIKISNSPKQDSSPSSNYFSDMLDSFKFIFRSDRMKALLLFSCVTAGVISVAGSFSKVYLTNIGISSVTFGYIISALSIISAIGSSYQDKFQNKRRKKTLSYISITYSSVFLFVGIPHLIGFNPNILLICGLIVFSLQSFFKGSYRVIMKKYLNNFTSSSIRPKIMSVYYLSEMFGNTVSLFFASRLLGASNIGVAYIICGSIFLVIIILVLEYMRSRIGLKPEQYKKHDILINLNKQDRGLK
ncbi:MAG: MFS transporter [Clostridia bacterium]|nr:MFS transporter [Clostridia bacterium]